jgi:glycosyltransferase involved in cell wall biosynthesis
MKTIMMATYNRLELTKKTMESLEKTVSNFPQIVIVDNGSTDGTVDYLKEYMKDKTGKLILNTENAGICKARNQALWAADQIGTDWYCTLDNDVEMPVGWLEECIGILQANPVYGAIGVNFESQTYPLVKGGGYEFQHKPRGNLGTACMVFGKKLHKSIGFFKSYGTRYGLEDSDFGMRAQFFGFKLGYIKENGIHLGVGEFDTGEYRRWKTHEHDSKVQEFRHNCALYSQGKLPIYVSYKED